MNIQQDNKMFCSSGIIEQVLPLVIQLPTTRFFSNQIMWVNLIQLKYARVVTYVEFHHSIGNNFRDQLVVERVDM